MLFVPRSVWHRLLLLAGLGSLLALLALWLVAGALIAPSLRPIVAPVDFPVENIGLTSGSGARIHGWFVAGQPGRGVVLLLHGVRANRTAMLPRARFLHAAGYSVLLLDLQAHGESVAPFITFGALEAQDVVAALDYLARRLPRVPIGVIAVSLGGAALVLSEPERKAAAVVLESVYPTIESAVANRLESTFGSPGTWLAPLLLWQLAPRTGIAPEQLRPIKHIANLGAPLLLLHGDADRSTRLFEAYQLFAAAREPKTIWVVPGAAHVDLYRHSGADYERKVLEFLGKSLKLNPD